MDLLLDVAVDKLHNKMCKGYGTHVVREFNCGLLKGKKMKMQISGMGVWLVISYDRHWTTVMTRESKNFYPAAKT